MEEGTVPLCNSTFGGSFKNPEYDCGRELNKLVYSKIPTKMKIPPRFKFMSFRRHNRQLEIVKKDLKNAYEVILQHVHNHSHEEVNELVLEVRKSYPNYQHELAIAEKKIKNLELKVKLLQLQIYLLENGGTNRDYIMMS